MAAKVVDEYKILLADFIKGTREGSVEWVRVNPTTYAWENNRGKVNIQRVEKKRAIMTSSGISTVTDRNYFLRAYDLNGDSIVSVSSSEYSELEDELRSVFDLAAEAAASRGLKFLKGMLD